MDRTAVYALDRTTHVLSLGSVLRLFETTSARVKISLVLIHDRLYYRPKGIFVTKTDKWAFSFFFTKSYCYLFSVNSTRILFSSVMLSRVYNRERDVIAGDVLDYLLYLSSSDIPCWVEENRCYSPWSVQCPQIIDVTRILRFTAMLNVLLRYFCMCTALLNAVRVH